MLLSAFLVKLSCGLILALITVGSGMIPLIRSEFTAASRIMSLSNAFAGGIFLAIGLVDLMPDAQQQFYQYEHSKNQSYQDLIGDFPLVNCIAVCSFSLLLLIQRVILGHSHGHHEHNKDNEDYHHFDHHSPLIKQHSHTHGHGHDHDHIHSNDLIQGHGHSHDHGHDHHSDHGHDHHSDHSHEDDHQSGGGHSPQKPLLRKSSNANNEENSDVQILYFDQEGLKQQVELDIKSSESNEQKSLKSGNNKQRVKLYFYQQQ